jgi:hypothetical protein
LCIGAVSFLILCAILWNYFLAEVHLLLYLERVASCSIQLIVSQFEYCVHMKWHRCFPHSSHCLILKPG